MSFDQSLLLPELIGGHLGGVDVGLALHEALLDSLQLFGELGPVLVLDPGRRGSVRLGGGSQLQLKWGSCTTS